MLADFAATFHMSKMRSGNPSVYLLKEQFESFSVSPHKVDACDRIAHYLHQLEQFDEAANWYEAAGRLTFSGRQLRPELRALLALADYEKAAECYRQGGDSESEAHCTEVLSDLKKACAPA